MLAAATIENCTWCHVWCIIGTPLLFVTALLNFGRSYYQHLTHRRGGMISELSSNSPFGIRGELGTTVYYNDCSAKGMSCDSKWYV